MTREQDEEAECRVVTKWQCPGCLTENESDGDQADSTATCNHCGVSFAMVAE